MSAPWENPPASWEAAALDDHGNPAIWIQCDACDQWSWCLRGYSEATGPCELEPDYEDLMREALADPRSGVRPGAARRLRGEGGPLCGNCAAVMVFCVDQATCYRRQGLPWPPPPPPKPQALPRDPGNLPPWQQAGGELP